MGDAQVWQGAVDASGMMVRRVALSLLYQVLQQKRALDEALERDAYFPALDPRDRGFVRMLVTTALRRKGQMDDLLRRAMDTGEEPNPVLLKIILYTGLCQVFFMDVPDHAAVDTTVTLAEENGLSRQKGFVNALMRRMTGEGREWVVKQDAVRMNFPGWILDAWIKDYGLQTAAQIAEASLAEAPLDITVKNPDDGKIWQTALGATLLPTGSLRRTGGGPVGDLPGLAEGQWWVQDAAAALPGRLLGDVSGRRVIDLCAAPGGKTMQLAAAGAHVIAIDRSSSRMKILHQNLHRTGLSDQVEMHITDGAEWHTKNEADIVLLDAPCSATGTIRRHPDLLHLKSACDVSQLAKVQERLLARAASLLKPGGTLLYCTCSLQKDEGERQAENFLQGPGGFKRWPVTSKEIGGLTDAITPDGDVRLLPYHMAPYGGMDGFFISRMIKH